MKLTYQYANESAAVINIPFGFPDDKGRMTGYRCTIEAVVVVEGGEGHWCPDRINAPGKWFRLHGAPTRADAPFGPAFNYNFFATYADAVTHGHRMANNCRTKYARKWAKAA